MTTTSFRDRLVFVDVETVTLDPQPGSVWEIAVAGPKVGDDVDVTLVKPDLSIADPEALEVGDFASRYNASYAMVPGVDDVNHWLHRRMPRDAVIVGSNPLFDIAHLTVLWCQGLDLGRVVPWHHHPHDLPSMVAGVFDRWPTPHGSLSLSWAAKTVGIDPDKFDTHTAAGDVRLAIAIWDVTMHYRDRLGHIDDDREES